MAIYNQSVFSDALPQIIDLSGLGLATPNGSIQYSVVSLSDGTSAPAEFSFSNVNNPATFTVANSLSAGTYALKFTDSTGKSIVYAVSVVAPSVTSLTLTPNNDTVNFSNTSSSVTLNGLGGNDNLTTGSGNDLLNGGDGIDTLTGNGGNDILDGGAGNDRLNGGAGDDVYFVDSISDVITEGSIVGSGTDSVYSTVSYTLVANVENLYLLGNNTNNFNGTGNASKNFIVGNTGNNVLSGLGEKDTLIGGDGNDSLNGGIGIDSLIGGNGDDIYVVDVAGDALVEASGAGTDLVQSSINYVLGNDLENLTLTGGTAIDGTGNTGANTITGNAAANKLSGLGDNDSLIGLGGNDTLTGGDGDDTLDGSAGNDSLLGEAGNDIFIINSQSATDVINGGADSDTIQSSITYTLANANVSNVENLTLTGSTAINGTGNSLANIITGNDAANILDDGGAAAADVLNGGGGNDTYKINNTGDVITDTSGIDTVQSSVTFTLTDASNVENLTLLTLSANNDFSGTGNYLNNIITGNNGSNTLTGNDGADTLNGGSFGNDVLIGGSGDDTYVINAGVTLANVTITENAGEGTDTLKSAVTVTSLANEVENLTLTGIAANGTGNVSANVITGNAIANLLTGGDGDDTLIGDSGSDTLDGGLGSDSLVGGIGNDVYLVDGSGDVVAEDANAGTDTVKSSLTYILSANVENLTLLTGAVNGLGNALDNSIVGNDTTNNLGGDAGNDTLNGGSAGNDVLDGGDGNDTYIIDAGVNFAGITITEVIGQGVDTLRSAVTVTTLANNVENLVLTGTTSIDGTGNTSANVITGNTANNVLLGDDGADTLNGGVGNDSLDGGTGNDALIGGTGDDTLMGGTGTDSLSGGTGNDIYSVDDSNDVVTEALNAGTDSVTSSVTYTLSANVENLMLTGAGNGTGNDLANSIVGNGTTNLLTGNAGNDTLNGGSAGSDVLTGGTGNDTYIIDAGVDPNNITIQEAPNEGTDTLNSAVGINSLSAEVENLTLTGTNNINGTGNSSANLITGNDGDNTLDGLTGVDTLIGGSGNDTYQIDDAGEVVTEVASGGTDLVRTSLPTYSLGTEIENLTLTEPGATAGTGNSLNNVIDASLNTGGIILRGLGGDDLLTGGIGADTFVGGSGKDTLTGGITGVNTFDYAVLTQSLLGSYDVITDFNISQDLINVSNPPTSIVDVTSTTIGFLDQDTLSSVLNATNFLAYDVAVFNFNSLGFLAINDGTAGFSEITDAIIQVSSSINLTNITTANFV